MGGAGAYTLGYGCKEVDDAVHQAIGAGNGSSLRCAEEIYLAEKLIELHPWADRVRLAVSCEGARALAIHIARAASGKKEVVVCSGEGSSAAAQTMRTALGDALRIPNNDLSALQALIQGHAIGVIWMDFAHDGLPEQGFLERVRALARANGIVLIYDECATGFRQTFGGLHKLHAVEPDLAIFGKALGNGYSIAATIGRLSVMEAGQTSFDCGTGEASRIGPVAALETLRTMQQVESWEQISAIGNVITRQWQILAQRYGLKISMHGLSALAKFSIVSPNASAYEVLIKQEMLGKGLLAGTGVCVCTAHVPEVTNQYFEALEPAFALIAQCEAGRDVAALLAGRNGRDERRAD